MYKLCLIALVFITVFTPQKLPLLLKDISKIFLLYKEFTNKLKMFWGTTILQEINLEENRKKAQNADIQYLQKNKN